MAKLGIRSRPTRRPGSTQSLNTFITSLYSIQITIQQILSTFQKSGTTHSDFTDAARRFWNTYQLQAEEYDREFLVRHNEDADVSMIFAGLFCAVCATFVALIQPQLKPDPDDITHALLVALIVTMNGTIPPGLPTSSPPSPPSSAIIWSQSLLYASLGIGLYAALGAVMGKQWLNHYDSVGIRGSLEDRGKERQRKLEALMKWHFHSVLESLPFLLEASLFLFGIGLSAYLWDQQHTTGALYITINAVGILLYVFLTVAAARYPDCPFQTPFSIRLRRILLFLSISWRLAFLPIISWGSGQVRQHFSTFRQKYVPVAHGWTSKISFLVDAYLARPVRAAWKPLASCFSGAIHSMPSTFLHPTGGGAASPLGHSSWRRSQSDIESSHFEPVVEEAPVVRESFQVSSEVAAHLEPPSALGQTQGEAKNAPSESGSARNQVGPEVSQPLSPHTVWAQVRNLFRLSRHRNRTRNPPPVSAASRNDQTIPPLLRVWMRIKTFLRRNEVPSNVIASPLPSTDLSDAASVAWILETCTDSSVEAVTLEYMLNIDWPQNFNFHPLLDRFFLRFIECFETDEYGYIVESVTPVARGLERNAAYGQIFLFLYWHARNIAAVNVMKWSCPMVGGKQRKMMYNADRVPRDELTYLFLLTRETIDAHPNHPRCVQDLLSVTPGFRVLGAMSQTAAVALSRYWCHLLKHISAEEDLWTCHKHVLAMSAYVPMTPAVLTYYSPVFAQAMGHVWQRERLEEGDFDLNAMLSRICEIQEDVSSLAIPHHFFSSPHGRYISSFLLFLSYCAQTSWDLRLRLREENVALWCLDTCQSVYSGVKNEDFPISLSVWASCTLRLALTIMDNSAANSNVLIDPLSGLLRGDEISLDSDYMQALVPHLPWILAYNFLERRAIFSGSDFIDPLPIATDYPRMRQLIMSLQCIRFCVLIEIFKYGVPTEAHTQLPKAYCLTNSFVTPDDPSTQLYHTMILSLRQQLRTLTQVILSTHASNRQSLVVRWGPIYQLMIAALFLARNAARDEAVEDILVMLGDLSQHVPDLLHGSSQEHRWGLEYLVWAYNKHHNFWVHDDVHFIIRPLARILLTSSGVHRFSQLDPGEGYEYEEGCDQRMAIAITCAAWNPLLDPIEHAGGERKRVKISWAAVENTLVVLANTSDDVLRERVCCIRSVLEHPRRGEEEFEHPFGGDYGRYWVDEVYRQFKHRLEELGDLGDMAALAGPTSEPPQAWDATAAPIPPAISSSSPTDRDSGPVLAPSDPTVDGGSPVTIVIPGHDSSGNSFLGDQESSRSLGTMKSVGPGPSILPEGPRLTVTGVSQAGVDQGHSQ